MNFGHRTLRQELDAKMTPTDKQFIDIVSILDNLSKQRHTTSGQLPQLNWTNVTITTCKHPICITCKHLDTSSSFRSTVTGTHYLFWHSFSCSSSNLIYLITCKKCKKQYVGLTTHIRVNHYHQTNQKSIYPSDHFNFPDHNIGHPSPWYKYRNRSHVTQTIKAILDQKTTNTYTEGPELHTRQINIHIQISHRL